MFVLPFGVIKNNNNNEKALRETQTLRARWL